MDIKRFLSRDSGHFALYSFGSKQRNRDLKKTSIPVSDKEDSAISHSLLPIFILFSLLISLSSCSYSFSSLLSPEKQVKVVDQPELVE